MLLGCLYENVKMSNYYRGYKDGYKKGYRHHLNKKGNEENRYS